MTSLDALRAFLIVSQEKSFTRAASRLSVSQSALSHAIRGLEEKVGVRLIARTTRSVAATEAGERLLRTLSPALASIDDEIESLGALRSRPAGVVRLTTTHHGFETVLRPVLSSFGEHYPDIHLDIAIEDGLTDIVTERFDAGIRFGRLLQKDMIATRVGPDVQAAIVASPAYLAGKVVPDRPEDLLDHRCINYRTVTAGTVYTWEFNQGDERRTIRVQGNVTLNDGGAILSAALDGLGFAYLFLDYVRSHIDDGRLMRVLEPWCKPFAGYHLYHSSRRQSPPALSAFIAFLHQAHRQRPAR